ncbi:TspO/MBR family protein [Pararhizobium sp.]|uniref:TspO/MBR family protein n=1 Tax=Pararhizobium sp. TaxID=1977563 RepID=UPI0027158167|nr:TspO/MBR family protein [Pararhizobium sp.]MDO9417657.1 TspO/MBR family protein [Pararhizobium sp.]
MNKILIHVLFIAVVLGIGLLIGINNIPGEWYQALNKPAFNPPNWIFGPVWSILYVMIGIVGARAFIGYRNTASMRLWIVQLLLNFAWSPLFFGLRDISSALIVILILLVPIIAFIIATWNRDRLAAWLFVPYLAWVSFATLLNGSIYLMN